MTQKTLLALALLMITVSAQAETRVVDGDTLIISGVRIRLEAIDTPEISRPRCARELAWGLKARSRLEELLAGRVVTYVGDKLDVYRRTLAVVYADGVDVGEVLIAEGLAVRWRRGAKAKAERLALWCKEE